MAPRESLDDADTERDEGRNNGENALALPRRHWEPSFAAHGAARGLYSEMFIYIQSRLPVYSTMKIVLKRGSKPRVRGSTRNGELAPAVGGAGCVG
jgi:hypothetical protein